MVNTTSVESKGKSVFLEIAYDRMHIYINDKPTSNERLRLPPDYHVWQLVKKYTYWNRKMSL